MSGEVTVNRSMQAVGALGAGVSNVYSTIVGDTPEAKIQILEAVTNAESLGDHLGETLLLKDVVVQATTMRVWSAMLSVLSSLMLRATHMLLSQMAFSRRFRTCFPFSAIPTLGLSRFPLWPLRSRVVRDSSS
jgi:hypothetical protein